MINSNLGPISHHLATMHPLHTNRRTNRQQLYHRCRLQHSCSRIKNGKIWLNFIQRYCGKHEKVHVNL